MDQENLKSFGSIRTDFTPSEKSLAHIPSDGVRIARSSLSSNSSSALFNSEESAKKLENAQMLENPEELKKLKSFTSEPLVKEESRSLTALPAYDAITTGSDINITYSQLEENISTLKEAINTLKNSWNGETKNNISIINESWAGTDCAEYTKKLSNMDTKVQNTILALELLCNTYEKARDMVKDNQAKTVSEIINLS